MNVVHLEGWMDLADGAIHSPPSPVMGHSMPVAVDVVPSADL